MKPLRLVAVLFLTSWITGCAQPETASEAASGAQLEELKIGTFNMLRFGHGNGKDLTRMARLIKDGGFHIFSGIEVMTAGAPGELVKALEEETGNPWGTMVSKEPTGESSYKEYFAFFYRKDLVKPGMPSSAFCKTGFATTRQGAGCYAKDFGDQSDAPLFARDPYVGHFRVGHHDFALVAVHVVYGQSVHPRRRELSALRDVMRRVRERTPSADVVMTGDFNLALTPGAGGPVIQSDFFEGVGPRINGLVDGPTTLGMSSYDHVMYFDDTARQPIAGSEVVVRDFDLSSAAERDDFKVNVSDHLPVGASFDL